MTNTLSDVFRPADNKINAIIYDMIIVICGSLVLGISAQIKIFLPFSPVPVTGQTFAVLMIAAMLGSKRGTMAVIAYLIEGILGIPVFASGIGMAVLLGPTGGFLIGFVVAAYVVGTLAQAGWDRRIFTALSAMLAGEIIIYSFGVCWLSLMTNFKTALITGLYPFIAGDIVKITLGVAVLPAGWKLLNWLKIKNI